MAAQGAAAPAAQRALIIARNKEFQRLSLTGRDIRAAIDAVLSGRPVSPDQKPSMGCNIKWKPGNEPDYA